jgi:hypothetical protein
LFVKGVGLASVLIGFGLITFGFGSAFGLIVFGFCSAFGLIVFGFCVVV